MDKTYVVFDTNCLLCSGFVHFILKHERDSCIQFFGAWSELGLGMAKSHGLSQDDLNKTFLVVQNEIGFTHSTAALKILIHLKMPWRLARVFKFIPRFIRDGIYSLVARHRYKWFGYKENCLVVPHDQRGRFISI